MNHPTILVSFHSDGSVTVASAGPSDARVLVRVRQVGALGAAILGRLVEALFHGTKGERTLVLLGTSPRAGNLALPVGTPVVRLPSHVTLQSLLRDGQPQDESPDL